MKSFQAVVLLAMAAGTIGYVSKQQPIYAATNGAALNAVPSFAGAQAAPTDAATSAGAKSYASHCSMCHGVNREGMVPIIPTLMGVTRKLTDEQILGIVHNGRGKMPAQAALPTAEVTSIVAFLKASDLSGAKDATASSSDAKPSSNIATSGVETNANNNAAKPSSVDTKSVHAGVLNAAGNSIFQQNCAFCHGRDAGGGEAGPDLTRSKLVAADMNGDKISDVVLNGRIEKKMPAFKFSSTEITDLVAYIHGQAAEAKKQKPGGRKGVDVEDLQTGNVEAGKQYFNGGGGCAKCHSATGDLAGIATRYEGLQLEERMLYPRDVKSKVAVTLPTGEKIPGILAYQDEFVLGVRDNSGVYRSWNVADIKYVVDSPVDAHVEQFPRYTDENIHDLMAYLQTMR